MMFPPRDGDYCRACGGIRPEWYRRHRVRGWLHLACRCCSNCPSALTVEVSGVDAHGCGCISDGASTSVMVGSVLLDGVYNLWSNNCVSFGTGVIPASSAEWLSYVYGNATCSGSDLFTQSAVDLNVSASLWTDPLSIRNVNLTISYIRAGQTMIGTPVETGELAKGDYLWGQAIPIAWPCSLGQSPLPYLDGTVMVRLA